MADTLRALAASLVALIGTRAELALVELREEAERRKAIAILAATAGVFFSLGAFLFAVFVVILFWDAHRVEAAAGMTVAYVAIGLGALWRMRRRRRESPPAFEATRAQFFEDVEALRGRHD